MFKQFLWPAVGLAVIHLLMYFTFFDQKIFWYLYSGTALVMIAFSISQSGIEKGRHPINRSIMYGIFSGLILYGILFFTYQLFLLLPGQLDEIISSLYKDLKPDMVWQLLSLILIIVPAEEIFWRGFIQRKLLEKASPVMSVAITSILSASVFLYSGEWTWMAAAFMGSIIWGIIYNWKRSISLIVISHLVFDLLFFYVVFI
ncbi:CPBP family intramembrane glutamic endopeptidase [Jeotgalibacillus proteolyticus]|uniref:CPBP family intramembrane glutamic endopeptidase n=1 Tax=Jeotgalibacillus proteolyticus TaxID=2082395 RepID=UPI003CEBF35F